MSSATFLNFENVAIMEQATLKTPVDNLRKLHKTTQKTYEHNIAAFQKDLDSLLQLASTPGGDRELMLKKVDGMLGRMRGVKRKLSELSTLSTNAMQMTKARISYLEEIPASTESEGYDSWFKKRLSLQLCDHFLRNENAGLDSRFSRIQTARLLAQETGIQELVDFELWEELSRLENALSEHKLESILGWISENRPALKKLKSQIEFVVHLQAFIELCRNRKLVEAIEYSKRNLSPAVITEDIDFPTEQLKELNQAMGLLVFAPGSECKAYEQLYSFDRWVSLRTLFRSTFLTLHSLPPLSLLTFSLQAGLSALKTPQCCPHNSEALSFARYTQDDGDFPTDVDSNSNDIEFNFISNPAEDPTRINCPLCNSPLRVLAPEVPYSHHVNSNVVCSLTGKLLQGGGVGTTSDSNTELVAVISKSTGIGHVYSRRALEQHVAKSSTVCEPYTKEPFAMKDLKRVFIS